MNSTSLHITSKIQSIGKITVVTSKSPSSSPEAWFYIHCHQLQRFLLIFCWCCTFSTNRRTLSQERQVIQEHRQDVDWCIYRLYRRSMVISHHSAISTWREGQPELIPLCKAVHHAARGVVRSTTSTSCLSPFLHSFSLPMGLPMAISDVRVRTACRAFY